MAKTEIWCKEPGKNAYLMNTIDYGSTFTNTKWPPNSEGNRHLPEVQAIVAKDIIQGWKMNGNKHQNAVYEIRHV